MVVIEYKRFKDWEEVFSQVRNEINKLDALKKIKKVGNMEQGGVAMEVALNKLGDDGWRFSIQSQLGIFFLRETTQKDKAAANHTVQGILGLEEEEVDAKASGQTPPQKP